MRTKRAGRMQPGHQSDHPADTNDVSALTGEILAAARGQSYSSWVVCVGGGRRASTTPADCGLVTYWISNLNLGLRRGFIRRLIDGLGRRSAMSVTNPNRTVERFGTACCRVNQRCRYREDGDGFTT